MCKLLSASLAVAALLLGCSGSSSDSDGGVGGEGTATDSSQGDIGERKPCPPGGLGVTAASGKSCSSIIDPNDPDIKDCAGQMTSYKDYACSEPQICPDVGVHALPSFEIGSTPLNVSFVITNCSTGNKKLRVATVEMEGDKRCFFGFNAASAISATEIAPGDTALIQATYAPTAEGEDHAAISVYSNAQNFPGLMLMLCGRAVKAGATPGPLTCQAVSGVEACHK